MRKSNQSVQRFSLKDGVIFIDIIVTSQKQKFNTIDSKAAMMKGENDTFHLLRDHQSFEEMIT